MYIHDRLCHPHKVGYHWYQNLVGWVVAVGGELCGGEGRSRIARFTPPPPCSHLPSQLCTATCSHSHVTLNKTHYIVVCTSQSHSSSDTGDIVWSAAPPYLQLQELQTVSLNNRCSYMNSRSRLANFCQLRNSDLSSSHHCPVCTSTSCARPRWSTVAAV